MDEEILWAIKNGDMEVLKSAADKPGFDVDKMLLNGRNALHYAADYGQTDIVNFLCGAKKAKINLPDKHGITALLAAIYEEHTECVRILLAKGADKRGKAPDGTTYLENAESDEIKSLLK